VVRRSQTNNPRSLVVLTSGADWGTRAAVQRRGSGSEAPMPRKQTAKLKTLQHVIATARTESLSEICRVGCSGGSLSGV
jgi:hypothetical protein